MFIMTWFVITNFRAYWLSELYMLNLLIVEGNTQEARQQAVASGSCTQGDLYEKTLLSLGSDLQCHTVFPADSDAILPASDKLAHYDGIIWTGSSLNIYEQEPAITRQIDFMKKCYDQKVKIFGSCWGLQVAVVAAGGEVAKNNKGREIGLARTIQTTEIGQSHPLYKGKTRPFDAVAIHLDHVVRLPEEATILSGNTMSEVQAIEIKRGESIFWGVQYHPEFDLKYIAFLMHKYKDMMVDEGICSDDKAVDQLASDFQIAQSLEGSEDIREFYKMKADVLDPCCRLQEISNWLEFVRQS